MRFKLSTFVNFSIVVLQSGMEVLQPELKFLTYYGSDLSYYDIKDITDAYRCTGIPTMSY